jgi:hypothetical protein
VLVWELQETIGYINLLTRSFEIANYSANANTKHTYSCKMPSSSADRRLSTLLPIGGPFGRPHRESLRDKSHAENVRWGEVQLYIKGEEWIYHPVILQAREKNSSKGVMADMKAHSLKVAAACPFIKGKDA